MIAATNSKRNILAKILCLSVALSAQGAGDSAHKDAVDVRPGFGISNPLIEQRADPWCFRHTDDNNSFTVAADGKTDLLFYHARNYRDIEGDPLRNPDRHTRVQMLGWKQDGAPDFGKPAADGPLPQKYPEKEKNQ